jgi:hypothetical protein
MFVIIEEIYILDENLYESETIQEMVVAVAECLKLQVLAIDSEFAETDHCDEN